MAMDRDDRNRSFGDRDRQMDRGDDRRQEWGAGQHDDRRDMGMRGGQSGGMGGGMDRQDDRFGGMGGSRYGGQSGQAGDRNYGGGSQMSGGEQQMLSIARTLMGNPAAILLDEPSEGIAPVIVQMMAEAIRAMKAEGVAVLLSEQNWAFAAGISDRACVIERGEIRFQGAMAALMADAALRAETLGV